MSVIRAARAAIAARQRKADGAGVTAAPSGPTATLERDRPSFRRGESRRNPAIIARRNDTAMTPPHGGWGGSAIRPQAARGRVLDGLAGGPAPAERASTPRRCGP